MPARLRRAYAGSRAISPSFSSSATTFRRQNSTSPGSYQQQEGAAAARSPVCAGSNGLPARAALSWPTRWRTRYLSWAYRRANAAGGISEVTGRAPDCHAAHAARHSVMAWYHISRSARSPSWKNCAAHSWLCHGIFLFIAQRHRAWYRRTMRHCAWRSLPHSTRDASRSFLYALHICGTAFNNAYHRHLLCLLLGGTTPVLDFV